MVGWKYDSFFWIMLLLEDMFFCEVYLCSVWRVFKYGFVLFVVVLYVN